jgi:hypothetical protein
MHAFNAEGPVRPTILHLDPSVLSGGGWVERSETHPMGFPGGCCRRGKGSGAVRGQPHRMSGAGGACRGLADGEAWRRRLAGAGPAEAGVPGSVRFALAQRTPGVRRRLGLPSAP